MWFGQLKVWSNSSFVSELETPKRERNGSSETSSSSSFYGTVVKGGKFSASVVSVGDLSCCWIQWENHAETTLQW